MYDRAFYETSEVGMKQSAETLVPLLIEWFNPKTMIDVGCGRGWWARTFEEHGVTAWGVDGDYVEKPVCNTFTAADLEKNLPYLGQHDLALSLEVAEHLSEGRARRFIHDLCKLAPIVVFSAAIPGQGGTGHVNERVPEYWAQMFRAENYNVTGNYRWKIWDDDAIENWYRQNLLVAVRFGTDRPASFVVDPGHYVPHVIHPVLFDHVRSKL